MGCVARSGSCDLACSCNELVMPEYKSGACLAHSLVRWLVRQLGTRPTDLGVGEGDPGLGNGGCSGLAFPVPPDVFLFFREPLYAIVSRTGDGGMGGLVLRGCSKFPKKNRKRSGTYNLEMGFWVVEHWSTRHIGESG